MQYEVDVISEVVLLVDGAGAVVDAFQARGRTIHQSNLPITHYTYRSLLTAPGHCVLCGRVVAEWEQTCVSSGGFHAFAGLDETTPVVPGHRAENRDLPLCHISYDEFTFFLEADNLFSAAEIRLSLTV